MTDPTTKKIVLPSNFEALERLEAFVDKLQAWSGFDKELYDSILLVLSEAVTNAMIHGNKQNPRKNIHITARLQEKESLKIDIKDEGEGFDPANLPDPLTDKNLLKPGGRGVYIINRYAEEVEYSENGTRLSLLFLLRDK